MGIKYIEHVNGTATPDKIAVEYAVKDSAGNIIKDTYLKTWRPIKYGNTTLNDAATTLEFIAGSNISLNFSSGQLTIGNTYSYTHPTYDTASAAAVKIGRDATGHVVIGNALTAADVGAAASNHTHTQLENSLTLLQSGTSPGNSYELIFQRGTLTDSYNDWRIQDREGFLRFDQRGSSSSDWSQQVYFNTSGTVYATAFSGSGASLTSLNASNISSGTISVDRLPSITSAKISDFTTAARGVISGTSPISYSSSTGAITHATALSAAVTSGLYKIAVDTYGHITGTAAVQSSDISGLESDPVFSASAAAGITSTDITNWNSKTSNTGTVIGSGLTAEYFVVGNSGVNVKISSMRPSTSSTTWSASSDVYVPTMKAISNYVTGLGYTSNTGTVIGSSLTANYFVVGNGTVNVKASSMQPTTSSTTWSISSDVNVPTMKAISSYVTGLGYTSNTGTVIGSSLTAEYFVVGNGTVNVKVSSMRPSSSSTTWSTSSDVYVPTMKAISDYIAPLVDRVVYSATCSSGEVGSYQGTISLDDSKTGADIIADIESGKTVVIRVEDSASNISEFTYAGYFSYTEDYLFTLTSHITPTFQVPLLVSTSSVKLRYGVWMESTSNKIQSITSSSTTSEYPSAKAVYNLISNHSHYWANVSTATSSSTETSPTFADTTVLNYKFRQSGTTTVKAQMAYDNTEEAIKFTFV